MGASKIREIGIYPVSGNSSDYVEVPGRYNSKESFHFGTLSGTEEAKQFMEKLHHEMQEG